ncbi:MULTISPECIES: chromate transporter [Anaerostipes]|uniref:chromate transporter n=1 Tax=Anaerostipes TaxID=207244 RepID=UPI00095347D0|nr:chromate transporter [Anaerostipes sp. 494a]MDY2725697.1 chromate transporter [Anaerostipes faecalis]OLR58886.1 chromate transporter [Anaerostipes sp. 494a]
MIFLRLFIEFLKAGLFAVGGGLATLPFLYDIMHETGWFTMQDLTNLIAVSECTPGPLGVNMATYVGNLTAGPIGGIIATIGLVTPSIIIIIIVANFLQRFKDAKLVQNIFYGLRPASTALIACALCLVAKTAFLQLNVFEKTGHYLDLLNWKHLLLGIILYIALVKFKKHPVIYIAIGAVCGIIFQL